MAKPPPVRPWSRLASLHPVPQPIPSPQNQPSQQPLEPSAASLVKAPRFLPAPSASLPNSPPKPSQLPKTSTMDNNVNANATKSPRTTPPPSPLASLPPPQLRADTEVKPEIKGDPVRSNLGRINIHNLTLAKKEVVSQTTEENRTKEKGVHKKLSNPEESGTRVITISGENRGAYMKIVQSSKKLPNFLHKMGNSKAHDHESENANGKNKNHKERTLLHSPPMSAYIINSNVQSVNNSLLYNTSCTSNDPGVQLN